MKRLIATIITIAFILTQCGLGITAPMHIKEGRNLRVRAAGESANVSGEPSQVANEIAGAMATGNRSYVTNASSVGNGIKLGADGSIEFLARQRDIRETSVGMIELRGLISELERSLRTTTDERRRSIIENRAAELRQELEKAERDFRELCPIEEHKSLNPAAAANLIMVDIRQNRIIIGQPVTIYFRGAGQKAFQVNDGTDLDGLAEIITANIIKEVLGGTQGLVNVTMTPNAENVEIEVIPARAAGSELQGSTASAGAVGAANGAGQAQPVHSSPLVVTDQVRQSSLNEEISNIMQEERISGVTVNYFTIPVNFSGELSKIGELRDAIEKERVRTNSNKVILDISSEALKTNLVNFYAEIGIAVVDITGLDAKGRREAITSA